MSKQKIVRLKQSEIVTLISLVSKPKYRSLREKLYQASNTSALKLESIERQRLQIEVKALHNG